MHRQACSDAEEGEKPYITRINRRELTIALQAPVNLRALIRCPDGIKGLHIGVSILPRVQYTDDSDFIQANSKIETMIAEAEAPDRVSEFF